MELDLFRTHFVMIGLGVSIAGGVLFYKHYRDMNTLLLLIGFILVFISSLILNYCLGLYFIYENLDGYGGLCSPVIPYVKSIGFICIGLGLVRHVRGLADKTKA